MEFRLLGSLQVVDGAREVTPARPKQRALLALLLLRAGEAVSVDEIVDALWGERPPPAARNAVQGHVSALRKILGVDRLATRGGGYVLEVEDDEFDLDRFERLVTDARGRHPERAAATLAEALALFRGSPLEEFRYDAFASAEAARIEELRLSALEQRVEAELALGRHEQVVPELERLVAEHPLRERLHAQLMLALYRSGRQAEALEAYRRARRVLVDAVGIEPGTLLQKLERQILNQDPELDSGHGGAAQPRVEIPTPPNPLLGRERELERAREILLRDDVRLLTLTGPGGTGKTRLALELARTSARHFERGTFFVPLAPLADASLVLPTVARALGVREPPGRPLEQAITAWVGSRPTLIVLDNFEHVIGAAVAVADLLAAAPALKVLVTSREALRVMAEHRYPVPPLDEEAAVALFLARAGAVRPDIDTGEETVAAVAEICRRLDRLPLSIELAAARTTVLSPEALVTRLGARLQLLSEGFRDQPPRQQTLKRTLEWSYELLTPDEQRVFARLAVFSGGWSLDAADAVCGEGLDVVDALSSLTDKSLVQLDAGQVEPRPLMLETIREYAAERLDELGEAAQVRLRHALYFLALAEEAEPDLPLSARHVLDRLEREHDNLRAALDHLEASAETELALRLVGSIWRFWYLRGHLTEGRRRIEAALAADDRPTAARAKALNGAAAMAMNAADVAAAKRRSAEAIELHRRVGDAAGAAYARFMLGNAFAAEGDPVRAQELYAESIVAFLETGVDHFALLARRHLAFACESTGDAERARALHEENLSQARLTGNARIEATSLGALAEHALRDGRLDDATAMLTESVRIHRDVGDVLDTAVDLCRFAVALARGGRAPTALRLVASLDALGADIGARSAGVARMNETTIASAREQLDDAGFAEAWAQGRALTLEDAVALALASAD